MIRSPRSLTEVNLPSVFLLTSQKHLTFSESFHCRLLFSGKAKNSPKKFERFKPLLGRPNRSNFFSDANYSFILLLKHSRMHKEPFQIISQKTVVGCPWIMPFFLIKPNITISRTSKIFNISVRTFRQQGKTSSAGKGKHRVRFGNWIVFGSLLHHSNKRFNFSKRQL